MMFMLVLVLCLRLVRGQNASECPNDESCLYPAGCRRVTPVGVDPSTSPYYGTMFSNVTGVEYFDNICTTFFILGPSTSMFVASIGLKDGTYSIMYNVVGGIGGSPGAYRQEQAIPFLGGSCVYNDYTINVLDEECEGIYLAYRCYIEGECVELYSGQVIVYAFSSSPGPVPPSCMDRIQYLVGQQGLDCLPLVYLSKKLPHRCIVRINGLTAINADRVPPEYSVEIDGGEEA